MEKRGILWTILTAMAISLVIVARSLTFSVQHERTQAQEVPVEETNVLQGYVMRIDGDQITLFRTGSTLPYQRLDIPLTLLSEYDLARLEEGIEVETEAEMRQLVEDFTS